MRSDTVLDYAVFELSPKHSRCELFVSSNEKTEKLASGLIEPFVNHLRVLEEQASPTAQSSIRLEVESSKAGNTWFTKRTLERFVQYVNSPEALERVNTCYSEMSQLEAARTLYSQRSEDSKFGASDDGAAADATKKELLRAIELRIEVIKKDLTTSIAHASASGFDPHTVSELQQFADKFGAHHLDEACSKYISLWRKRPDLIDMKDSNYLAGVHNVRNETDITCQKQNVVNESEHQIQQCASTSTKRNEEEKSDESVDVLSSTVKTSQHTRRLSVQDRINLFEGKQKENSNSGGSKPVAVTKSTELRRPSSGIAFSERSITRRNSIASDMSIDLASENKLESFTEGPSFTPSPVLFTEALMESKESVKEGDAVKYDLKSDSRKVGDEESSRDRVKSSQNATEENLVSGVQATSDAQVRSVTDSNDSSGSQNQTASYVDRLQREEDHELKANYVSQSSPMFPARHTRSRSAHIEAGFREDLASQPQFRSSVSRIKKKEMVPSEGHSVLSQKPHFNASDGPDDGEGRQVRANSHWVPTASVEQIHRTRLSKENPGANDELEMKANELEKLFAEHKLRVPGDQSSSSRRGKPSETQVSQPEPSHSIGAAEKNLYPGGRSGDLSKLITPMVGDKDKGDALRRNFSDLSFTDDSKGKFYEKYMKKRDAKLREEWSSKKGEKETKLKSMQEALEQSRTEMKAKFSASSSERQAALSSTRQRAEKFRSFNSRSSMKKYQHPINSLQSEEDEDFSDQKPRAKDKLASGQQSIGNIASRSSQARKLQPNRNMTSSITSKTAASVPKPSGKVSNTSSGRRRSDKSLAQSVPNFSDLIKENTKPSSLAVKTTIRSQVRSSGRPKNTKEDTPLQRPRSLRKSSSGNIDFTELSTLCSDDMMASLRVDSDLSENLKNEEYDEPEAEVEEALENAVREEEEEEEEVETSVFKDGNPLLSEAYEKVDNSGEENYSFLPDTVLPTGLTVSSLMNSPGESPLSWNANLQHSFSYHHGHSSDVDASADSPMGSPASWSSRLRKKWGTTQSPVAAAAAASISSSQIQSRKDLTKGFKRLLKFGRKSRGAESLMMDWVSVTTSEGDDEVEDRRDLADRSSDDLRKSRMGSLQSHLSEDGFNESEFTEQASSISIPELKEDHQISGSNIKAQKSFFSLSTFRGKGNDSKPR